ncbi:MAG: ABC transporter substrate-binding protein [Dehalococcoidia bacterium]|nr:ABC transporter substrate-binding protein [Dehalococcoidia bacterium]
MRSLTVIRRGSALALALAALTGVALGAACGDDDSAAPATTPTATTSASASAASQTTYPLKVTDLLGREVEIKAKPKTIVALSPTAVEYVYAVGASVVGRSQSADYPAAAQQAKEVGTAYQPNPEAILALKPDLVIADSVIQAQPDLRKTVEGLGVPVLFAGADSYQKVVDGVRLVGKVLDANAQAAQVVQGMEKARDNARAALSGKKVSAVTLIAGRDQTLYAAKDNSYAGDIMKQVGITNPAASQPDAGPFPGYTTLAPEKLVEFNPDVIFTITPGPASIPRLSTLVPQIPPFKGLKAVTGGKVIELDVELFLESPGPRVVDAFKAISDAAKASAQ